MTVNTISVICSNYLRFFLHILKQLLDVFIS